jgi:serine/threonine protein kinase
MGDTDDRIGPYRVLRRLGVGGMAEAFEALRAHDRGVAHRVCVKRVLPAYAEDAELVRLFEHEARMMAALAHANIVGVIDVGAHEGRPYLVLELVDGIDLRALLQTAPGKRLDADIVRFIAYELATALAFAHTPDPPRREFGVVHRDLSPSNVLIARGGEVRLTDFGLAKAVAAQPVTQSGAVRGKIPYMAPEHMRGAPIDARADLFSLGVILFECLAGVRPFDGSHEVETMTRVLAGTRLDLGTLRPELEPGLVALVSRLLETEREARFPDAKSVVEAIHALGPVRSARAVLGRLVETRLGGMKTRAHVLASQEVQADERGTSSSFAIDIATPVPPTALAKRSVHDREKSDATVHDGALHAMLERTAAPLEDAGPQNSGEPTALLPREPRTKPRLRTVAVLATSAILVGVAARGAMTFAEGTTKPAHASVEPARRDAPAAQTALRAPPREAAPVASPVVDVAPPVVSAAPDVVETDAPDDDAPSGGATARIVIEPWGKVWVDGRPVGRAPRSITLSPGTHVIEGGFESPTHRRNVTLVAGERRRIELDITPRD